jgi:hypothetical protein
MFRIGVGIYSSILMTRRWDVAGGVTGPAEERAAVRSRFLLLAALHGDGVLPGNAAPTASLRRPKGWILPDSERAFSNPMPNNPTFPHRTDGKTSSVKRKTDKVRIMKQQLTSSMAVLLLVACGSVTGRAASNEDNGSGPVPVTLGMAGTFAILSKTGITDVYASKIVGDVGTSPITGAALLLTCGEVSGRTYTVDAAGPLPCVVTDATFLTAAVNDMGFAYDDAAGRLYPDVTELGAGEIGGLTLEPGLYKWGTGVLITTDVTLAGGPNDVWILQVAGTLNQGNATRVTLAGGARAENIFWQVAGAVTIGTTAHFEGVVLAKTMIAVNTGASVTGRLLAQTAVTLQMNAVTQPAR